MASYEDTKTALLAAGMPPEDVQPERYSDEEWTWIYDRQGRERGVILMADGSWLATNPHGAARSDVTGRDLWRTLAG